MVHLFSADQPHATDLIARLKHLTLSTVRSLSFFLMT